MTLFRTEKRQANVVSWRDFERAPRLSGLDANREAAMTHSAVYECVDLIADLVSGFPVARFREVNDARVKVSGSTVVEAPSDVEDAVNWRRIIVANWLRRGYQPGLINGMSNGFPSRVELVDPHRVTVERRRADAPWEWKLDGSPIGRFPDGPLWVAPGKKLDPGDPVGRSVLEFAAAEIGMGLASRKFGADFFAAGGHPTSVLMGDGEVNEDLSKRVKRRFLEAVGSREPVVMGGAWKYQQVQIAPNESQFLETIKANRTMVAGFFKVPPHMIGAPSGDGMTYKNVEQDGINLLRFCVQPWVTRMEVTLNALTPRPQFVKLNMDALLRPDLSTRYRAHDVAIRAGFKSVNDVRRVEDLPAIPDGDEYLWPPYRSQLTEPEMQAGADGETDEEPDD